MRTTPSLGQIRTEIDRRVGRGKAAQQAAPSYPASPGPASGEASGDASGDIVYEGHWDFDLPPGSRREVVIPHGALDERNWVEFRVTDAETDLPLDGVRVTPVGVVSDGTYDDGSTLLALVEDV